MTRLVALVALSFPTAACAADNVQHPLPALVRFLSPDQGGPRVLPEASPSGLLDLSGPCVRLEIRPGDAPILISTAEAHVGRDARGFYMQYDDRRFRHGASVKGGGGYFERLPTGLGALDEPIPAACSSGPFVILSGIQPFDPSKVPPPRSPPPPPVVQ